MLKNRINSISKSFELVDFAPTITHLFSITPSESWSGTSYSSIINFFRSKDSIPLNHMLLIHVDALGLKFFNSHSRDFTFLNSFDEAEIIPGMSLDIPLTEYAVRAILTGAIENSRIRKTIFSVLEDQRFRSAFVGGLHSIGYGSEGASLKVAIGEKDIKQRDIVAKHVTLDAIRMRKYNFIFVLLRSYDDMLHEARNESEREDARAYFIDVLDKIISEIISVFKRTNKTNRYGIIVYGDHDDHGALYRYVMEHSQDHSEKEWDKIHTRIEHNWCVQNKEEVKNMKKIAIIYGI